MNCQCCGQQLPLPCPVCGKPTAKSGGKRWSRREKQYHQRRICPDGHAGLWAGDELVIYTPRKRRDKPEPPPVETGLTGSVETPAGANSRIVRFA